MNNLISYLLLVEILKKNIIKKQEKAIENLGKLSNYKTILCNSPKTYHFDVKITEDLNGNKFNVTKENFLNAKHYLMTKFNECNEEKLTLEAEEKCTKNIKSFINLYDRKITHIDKMIDVFNKGLNCTERKILEWIYSNLMNKEINSIALYTIYRPCDICKSLIDDFSKKTKDNFTFKVYDYSYIIANTNYTT